MKQAVLKIKNGTKIVAHSAPFRTHLLKGIFITLGILAVFYVFAIGSIIFNIIERNNLISQTKILSSEVGELELTYLSLHQELSLDTSSSFGFVEVKPGFATRTPLAGNLATKSGTSVKFVKNEI